LSPKEGLSNSKQSLATVNDSLLANYFFIIQKPDLIGSKTQSKGGQVDGYGWVGTVVHYRNLVNKLAAQ
jgi:hypothetical protein